NGPSHVTRRGNWPRRVVNRIAPLVRNVEVLGIAAQTDLPADGPSQGALRDLRLFSATSLCDALPLVEGSGLTLHPLAESRFHSGSTFWSLATTDGPVATGWV